MTKDIDLDALQALAPCPFCGKSESVKLSTTHEAWDDEEIYPDCAVVICDASSASKLGGCGASSGCHETEAEAIAAWNRRAGASAWQPIETAPKDRRVLVRTEREVYAAHWAKNPFTGDEAWIVAEWGNEGDQALVKPIEWMPAPAISAVRAAPEGGKDHDDRNLLLREGDPFAPMGGKE